MTPGFPGDTPGCAARASGACLFILFVQVHLHDELGVSYYKWDGIGQYGCDSPLHGHGTEANTPEERADCYAYEMGRSMIHIATEIARCCPGTIVDFDITEGGRFVGLGFGGWQILPGQQRPLLQRLRHPAPVRMDPDTINVFFYPGPARPRACRTGTHFDAVVPSVLFLTHYLPDAPRLSQENSLASLVLGGNGIWGDLLALSEDDMAFWSSQLAEYKRVAQAATRAYPRTRGFAGSSPELHEKLDPTTASDLVAFFTVAPGEMEHLTQPRDLSRLREVNGADAWERRGERLLLRVRLGWNDARVVYILGTY